MYSCAFFLLVFSINGISKSFRHVSYSPLWKENIRSRENGQFRDNTSTYMFEGVRIEGGR